MTTTWRAAVAGVALLACVPGESAGQAFESLGSRAQGMGAFVAVADDASAIYWNPGGLAAGSYFSLVFDRTSAEAGGDHDDRAADRSSWLLALTTPALGLGYYRLRSTTAVATDVGFSRVESLVTHHAGATLVHSLTDHLAVGATLKLVRGVATVGSALAPPADLLDDWDLLGVASNSFDADVGIMLTGNFLRAGLTLRNLVEPSFDAGADQSLRLDRQARAGLALLVTERWTAAADFDLTRNRGPFGDVRMIALGTEGRVSRRAIARGGVQFNTAGSGSDPVASLGLSYAAFGSLLVDAHFSTGADHGFGGWGVGARVLF